MSLTIQQCEQYLTNTNVYALLCTIAQLESGGNYRRVVDSLTTHKRSGDFTTSTFPIFGGSTTGHFIGPDGSILLPSRAAGCYQFTKDTWFRARTSLGYADSDFSTPHVQDVAAVWLMDNSLPFSIDDIANIGVDSSTLSSLFGTWPSLNPTAKSFPIYLSYGGSTTKGNNFATTKSPGETVSGEKPTGSSSTGTQTELTEEQYKALKNLIVNKEEVELNVNNLNLLQTNVIWGSRTNDSETSDWIGLKQYLLYLCTRYCPQSIVPFVELIPKFTLDQSVKPDLLNSGTGLGDEIDLTKIQRYNKNSELYQQLQNQGGIDLMTNDPFKDMKNFRSSRGFSFKTLGNVDLNNGNDYENNKDNVTSGAGAVGIDSVIIEMGPNSLDNAYLIEVTLKDIMGNKFLDTSSPWSFVLQPGQTNGDFWFRFGWQLRLPDPLSEDYDLNSISYKFWNHEGWDLFKATGSKTNAVRNAIAAIIGGNYKTIVLSQSITQKTITHLGYKYQSNTADKDSVDSFVYDLFNDTEDALNYYISLSWQNTNFSVDSTTGSITAKMVFSTTAAMANMQCMLQPNYTNYVRDLLEHKGTDAGNDADGKETKKVSLWDLLVAYTHDNEVYMKDQAKKNHINYDPSQVIILDENADEGTRKKNVVVRKPSITMSNINGNGDTLIDPATVYITFNSDEIAELQSTAKNNMSLISYLNSITGKSNCSQSYYQMQSVFNYIYLDTSTTEVKDAAIEDINAGTGNLLNTDISRLYAYDDVFSFRFQGSLTESLAVQQQDLASNGASLLNEIQKAYGIIDNNTDVTNKDSDGNTTQAAESQAKQVNNSSKQGTPNNTSTNSVEPNGKPSQPSQYAVGQVYNNDFKVNLNSSLYQGSYYTWKDILTSDFSDGPKGKTDTASTGMIYGQYNQSGKNLAENMIVLFKNVIDPATEWTGRKFTFSCTLRNHIPKGGAKDSYHNYGLAADISSFGGKTKAQVYEWIRHNCYEVVSECLYESTVKSPGSGGAPQPYPKNAGWIHVSVLGHGKDTRRNYWRNFYNHLPTTVSQSGFAITEAENNALPSDSVYKGVQTLQIYTPDGSIASASNSPTNNATSGVDTNTQNTTTLASLLSPTRTVNLSQRNVNLAFFLAQLSSVQITVLGHPWVYTTYPFWLKGTGYFDGYYVSTKVTHTISNGQFKTEIFGVRQTVNPNYSNIEDKKREIAEKSQNTSPNIKIAAPVNKDTQPTRDASRNLSSEDYIKNLRLFEQFGPKY